MTFEGNGLADTIGNNVAVDRAQAAPLYHQIFLQLREEITSGERVYGYRMPTERELAAQFNVSRITARRALDELAGCNLVARRRRTGTTVVFKAPPLQQDLEQSYESIINFGPTSTITLLELGPRAVLPPVDSALNVEPLTEVMRAVRLQASGEGPIGHFVLYLPPATADGVTRARLESASMLQLLDDAGIRVGGIKQSISATLTDAALSQALEVEIGSPLIRVSRTVFDESGRPTLHVLAKFRSDRYQIGMDFDLTDLPRSAPPPRG